MTIASAQQSDVRIAAPRFHRSLQMRHLSQSVILEEVGPPRLVRAILVLLSVTVFGFIAWAATITITETTKATGEVIPTGSVLAIQHLEGGIVSNILVRDGDLVALGDVLVELDPTAARAEQEVMATRRVAFSVRAERLRAFAEKREPDFGDIPDRFSGLVKDQITILRQQNTARDHQWRVQWLGLQQRRSELDVLQMQKKKREEQVEILAEQKRMREELLEKGLVSKIVYLNTRQEYNAATSELETVQGKIVRAGQAIDESESKLSELESKLRSEAFKEMGVIAAEMAEVERSIVRLDDRVRRLRIRSPARGIVKDLKTNTIGGVILPGGQISEVVPIDAELVVEARISPFDVGHVAIGQAAKVKITTYDFARFGMIEGTVEKISATTFKDPDGNVYYKAVVKLAKNHVGEDPDSNLVLPGMVAEIDITTGERTLLRYLLRPVYRSLDAAFSER